MTLDEVKAKRYCDGMAKGEELIGRADIGPDADDLDDSDFCDGLDSVAFNCAGCGWWCSVDEQSGETGSGEPVCDDCHDPEAFDD